MSSQHNATKSQPLGIFTITEREGYDRPIWTRVGSAFRNRDGSLNLHLEALPVNGRLHIRELDANRSNDRRTSSSDLVREEVLP
jgi:hypothetical protein